MIDLVEIELEGRDAAADADLEPAMAQMIEHRDLFDQAQRRIERQQVDQRPEMHLLGRARDRAEIDARRRHHVERRAVMLGHMSALETGLVRGRGELQPLVELLDERTVVPVDVIEKPNFIEPHS